LAGEAREPNDPDLPRPQARHLRRDHRGSQRTPPDRTAALAFTCRSVAGGGDLYTHAAGWVR